MKKLFFLFSLMLMMSFDAMSQTSLNGNWKLVSINQNKNDSVKLPEQEIIVTFDRTKFFGKICNNFSGNYSVKGKRIFFKDTISTMMFCDNLSEVERPIVEVMSKSAVFSLKKNRLVISDSKNKTVLQFEKLITVSPTSIVGKWKLYSMNLLGKEVIYETDKITLNIEKDKFGGNGGCNAFGGTFAQNGQNVKFTELFSTKMWCDNSPIEQQYFNALESIISYEITNRKLFLIDQNKKKIMTFKQ